MKPSTALQANEEQVRLILNRFGMRNPRIFGSVSRNEDTETSDLDIIVDAPEGTSLYDLAEAEMELEATLGCAVEILTEGSIAPDVLKRLRPDLIDIS